VTKKAEVNYLSTHVQFVLTFLLLYSTRKLSYKAFEKGGTQGPVPSLARLSSVHSMTSLFSTDVIAAEEKWRKTFSQTHPTQGCQIFLGA
jgi:hypothetical protein